MFAGKKHHREVGEIPLAPIIDMLVCVIFFLILSTSFTEYNKVTLPQTSTSVYDGPTQEKPKPPLSPRLYLKSDQDKYSIILKWFGEAPDRIFKANIIKTDLEKTAQDMAQEFSTKFPGEKSIQLAMATDIPYQTLVTVMDSILPSIPDIVLSSYQDIEQAGF